MQKDYLQKNNTFADEKFQLNIKRRYMEFGTTSKGKDTDRAPSFEITEDADNVFILDYIIPKENNKENFKKREKLIWEMYGRWCVENPEKTCTV